MSGHLADEPVTADQVPSRRKRTTELGVSFESGVADGWTYGVPPVFREAMDIRRLCYVDKEKTKALRHEKGRTKNEAGQLYTFFCMLWTRGIPPARSFNEGDVFYSPANVREMEWSEALKRITHAIQVIAAQPDRDDGHGGWVEFEVARYQDGTVVERSRHKALQVEFENVLRTGCIPEPRGPDDLP